MKNLGNVRAIILALQRESKAVFVLVYAIILYWLLCALTTSTTTAASAAANSDNAK